MTTRTSYLRILGEPALEGPDGESVELPRGKPLALLAYLALTPEGTSRDRLAQLFWAEASRDRSRGSLRQALWLLRRTVGEDLFDSDDPVRITPGRLRTDVDELRDRLRDETLEGACELWRGPPLGEGFHLGDAPEWERWLELLRSELEFRLGQALSDQVAIEREGDQDGRAAYWLRKACEVQPYLLQHHLDLAEIHLHARRFEEAAEVLLAARRELHGEDSTTEIAELENRIRTLRRGPPSGALEDPALRVEFSGRGQPFSQLVRRWRQARSGHSAIGVVVGEEGVGKSRLLAELALLVGAEGGRTVVISVEDTEQEIEWGLVGELVQRLLTLSGAGGISAASDQVLRPLVPSLNQGGGSGGVTRIARPSAALTDALRDLITAVSEDAPLAIVIDDLHHADPESRAVMTRVASQLSTASVLLLFGCEMTAGRDPRLQKTLTLLAEGTHSSTVELTPWSLQETEQIVLRTLQLSLDEGGEEPISRIARTSRGIPLFVVEILSMLRGVGLVLPRAGGEGWEFSEGGLPNELPLPPLLRRRIEQELDLLSTEAETLLLHLARLGQSTTARVLATRAGMDSNVALAATNELARRRLVRWEDGERLALMHEELRRSIIRRAEAHSEAVRAEQARWSMVRRLGVVAASIVLVGSGAYLFGRPESPPPPPLGGGSVYLLAQEATLTLRGSGGGSVRWSESTPDLWVPEGVGRVGPFRTTDGDLQWFEHRLEPDGRSRIVDLGSDGTEFFPLSPATSGTLLDLSPSGRFFIYSSAIPGSDPPSEELRMARRDGTRTWSLHRSEGGIMGGDWSQDAAAIAVGVRQIEGDSLIAVAFNGVRLGQLGFEEIHGFSWCGGSQELVLSALDDGTLRLLRWDIGADTLTELPVVGVIGRELVCSPDGEALIYQAAVDGEVQLLLMDLVNRDVTPLPAPEPGRIRAVVWVPDQVDPVPVAVQISGEEETIEMAWGDRLPLDAVVIYSDDSERVAPLTWWSLDPDVASVSQSGILTANRAGSTRILVGYGRWLVDGIGIEVRSDREPPTLYLDDLAFLNPMDWFTVGGAQFTSTGDETLPSVALIAAANRVRAGIISRPTFLLDRGGTLELEVLLPFPLTGATGFQLCLLSGEPPTGPSGLPSSEASNLQSWLLAQEACIAYPAGAPPRIDPEEAEIWSHAAFRELAVPIAPALPTQGWTHFAVALQPDGTSQFYLNRELIGTTPTRVNLDSGSPWRIGIFGRGTEEAPPQFRYLSLWPGVRY